MLGGDLFKIPFYSTPVLNFKEKKKQLTNLLKSYPEERTGIQTFTTNRQTDRQGLVNGFVQILDEEFNLLTQQIKKHLQITDIWSVTYSKGDYHSPHNHGSLGLAGILYLDLPKGSSVTNYIQPWNEIETDTTIYYPLPISEGHIIVVPQFIQHFSPPNESKKIKRVISWDLSVL